MSCFKFQEYPHHLVKINDKKRLIEFLKDWDVFHHYYIEAFSGELLALWRQVRLLIYINKAFVRLFVCLFR